MYKGEIKSILDADQQAGELPVIDSPCLQAYISNLKYRKASGYDGITNEHIIYEGNNLLVHLCLLFNSLIKHIERIRGASCDDALYKLTFTFTFKHFVPADFCFGIIVPLLKSKHGDASQIDMYRGITLSSCVSKLFDRVLVEILGEALDSDVEQYDFKKNCSTSHALFSFGESVRYFTCQLPR